MPASPSRPPSIRPRSAPPPAQSRSGRAAPPAARPAQRLWPWIAFGVLLVGAVLMMVLPASLLGRALPRELHAEDYSGTVWHGSVGKLDYHGIDAGALEWHLHPAALLRLSVAANIHWVKTSFVLDGDVEVNRGGFTAQNVHGGGPLEDLATFGIAPNWSGIASVAVSLLQGDFAAGGAVLKAAVGDLQVDTLASRQFTGGDDIGGYRLHAADGAITPATDAGAELTDVGGPLELRAVIHYNAKEHRVLLSGTVRERGKLPPALQQQLQNLAQLRPRDAQGRLPIDLEFTL